MRSIRYLIVLGVMLASSVLWTHPARADHGWQRQGNYDFYYRDQGDLRHWYYQDGRNWFHWHNGSWAHYAPYTSGYAYGPSYGYYSPGYGAHIHLGGGHHFGGHYGGHGYHGGGHFGGGHHGGGHHGGGHGHH